MGEQKRGLIHSVAGVVNIDKIKTFLRTVEDKITSESKGARRARSIISGVLIALNSVIFLMIPVLIHLSGQAQAAEDRQIATARQEAQGGTPQDIVLQPGPTKMVNADYDINDESRARIGIDVSYHQGEIDWTSVAANGIDFAIVRVGARGYTEGNIIADEYFYDNVDGAKAAGLYTGVYFFSQAVSEQEAIEEAEFVLEMLGGRALDYPIVYDMESVSDPEGRVNALGRAQKSANARAFCERVEEAGYMAMVYGNAKDMSYYDYTILLDFDIWFAQYDTSTPSLATYPIKMWQFTSSGAISGIEGRVDINVHFRDQDPRALPASVTVHDG